MLPLLLFLSALPASAEHLRLHPDNPHYFLFRAKPTVLITSAEHYGAVLNGQFDYRKYLDTLAKDKLNMTRIFTGVYREVPNDFGIARNTLAPEDHHYIGPYLKTGEWNPAYFDRLRDFIAEAGKRNIVVEVTLFCTYYRDHMWKLSPWHRAIPNTEVLSLKHQALTDLQLQFTRKIVTELKDFDNIYFEIANEPYFAGVTLQFQALIAKTIAETEASFPQRHLIAQNIANNHQLITNPDPNVSLFNFHYARPPIAVGENYHLNKAIGLDETGFDGTLDFVYRIQAWDFLVAGGAHYNNLDYSFAVGYEDGTLPVAGNQPGGGSATLRKQLSYLHTFMNAFAFLQMKPDPHAASGVAEGESVRVLSEPGKQYAVYLHRGRVMSGFRPAYIVNSRNLPSTFTLHLPPGRYRATWWNPRTGKNEPSQYFEHTGSGHNFTSPAFSEDLALEVRAASR